MVEVKVYSGGSVSSKTVDESVFGERQLSRTLKDAVVMYEANLRQGTHKAKTRGEVAGPNKKRWKQKHTGNARMGTKKSGIWRGGGVIFGPAAYLAAPSIATALGGLGLLGTASTGTAISSLSGAALTSASLAGNEQISCAQLDGLEARLGDNLRRPARCED